MAESLLAHLYSRIKGSQEDVATLSLQYLLSQSKDLNKAFTEFCSNRLNIEIQNNLQYVCQFTGEHNERPDMVGINSCGEECVLCEMKFYAGLTENQPLTYLDRLNKGKENGLIFICPESRVTVLWSELHNRCTEDGCVLNVVNKYCVTVDNAKLAIATWTEILSCLEVVVTKSASKYSADLYQLQGYCKQMDKEAFIPFSDKDLSADGAIKSLRFYDVIDETSQLILTDKKLKTYSVGKANSYYRGYERKFAINNFIIYLAYDLRLWKSNSSISTPFWVAICDENKEQPKEFNDFFRKIDEHRQDDTIWGLNYLALNVLQNESFTEVCENLKSQILDYMDLFK